MGRERGEEVGRERKNKRKRPDIVYRKGRMNMMEKERDREEERRERDTDRERGTSPGEPAGLRLALPLQRATKFNSWLGN